MKGSWKRNVWKGYAGKIKIERTILRNENPTKRYY